MKRVRRGYDEPLKALLDTQCPKLAKLTFLMYDIWHSVDAARCHPLKLLCYSICNLQVLDNPRDQWPIGL
jgi:hypothetical protein